MIRMDIINWLGVLILIVVAIIVTWIIMNLPRIKWFGGDENL